jgi:hypothetical protein
MNVPIILRATGSAPRFVSESPVFKPPDHDNYRPNTMGYEEWKSDYSARMREPPVRVRLT